MCLKKVGFVRREKHKILVHLSLDIICSSKLIASLVPCSLIVRVSVVLKRTVVGSGDWSSTTWAEVIIGVKITCYPRAETIYLLSKLF